MMNYLLPFLCAALLWGHPRMACGQPAGGRNILWTVDWKPDGSAFAVGGENTLWIFDAKTLKREPLAAGLQTPCTVREVAWDPAGQNLAVSDGEHSGIYEAGSVRSIVLKADAARGVSWNATGDRLSMSSGGDGHLRIWDAKGRLLHNVPRYKKALGLTGVAWSPSRGRIVTIGKYVTVRDEQGRPIRQITHRPEADERLCLLLCVKWHPSGKLFAIGDYGNDVDDPVLQLWTAEGELIRSIVIKDGAAIRNVSWNHDGTLLASASDGLRIWTKEGELKHKGEFPALLWGVDWRPDGRRILTSSMEGHVTLWDRSAKPVKAIVEPD